MSSTTMGVFLASKIKANTFTEWHLESDSDLPEGNMTMMRACCAPPCPGLAMVPAPKPKDRKLSESFLPSLAYH